MKKVLAWMSRHFYALYIPTALLAAGLIWGMATYETPPNTTGMTCAERVAVLKALKQEDKTYKWLFDREKLERLSRSFEGKGQLRRYFNFGEAGRLGRIVKEDPFIAREAIKHVNAEDLAQVRYFLLYPEKPWGGADYSTGLAHPANLAQVSHRLLETASNHLDAEDLARADKRASRANLAKLAKRKNVGGPLPFQKRIIEIEGTGAAISPLDEATAIWFIGAETLARAIIEAGVPTQAEQAVIDDLHRYEALYKAAGEAGCLTDEKKAWETTDNEKTTGLSDNTGDADLAADSKRADLRRDGARG